MHRLGDVVDVRLVEAAPVAGALRFELLSEGQSIPRGRKRDGSRASTTPSKARPGRSPNDKPGKAKFGKGKSSKGKSAKFKPGKSKSGSSKKGKSW
jgi:ribonuclease R